MIVVLIILKDDSWIYFVKLLVCTVHDYFIFLCLIIAMQLKKTKK